VQSTAVDLLITGFGPFLNIDDNPSSYLAENSGLPFRILPVTFAGVESFLAECQGMPPRRLLMLGVAAGRRKFTPELFGWNLNCDTADAAGVTQAGLIEPDGPFFRESTLWTKTQLIQLVLGGVTGLSGSPGHYLCNYALYRALGTLPGTKVGFLHVPGDQHMTREEMQQRFQTVLKELN